MKTQNDLLTMKEKEALDPNELMENGKTRKENEDIQKGADQIQGVGGLFVIIISLYCMFQAMSML